MFGSVLRMGNAATISRDKFVRDGDDWKLDLRTAKTGVSVFIPLAKTVVEAIPRLPASIRLWREYASKLRICLAESVPKAIQTRRNHRSSASVPPHVREEPSLQ